MRALILVLVAFSASASAQLNYFNVNASCIQNQTFTACLLAALSNSKNQSATLAINPGSYTIASTILVGADQRLIGAGSNGGGAGGGTTLIFSGNQIGIRFASYNGKVPPAQGGLQHLALIGPGSTSTAAIGIFLGGGAPNDPACTNSPSVYQACTQAYGAQLLFEDVVVSQFRYGAQIGNNAYLDTFRGVTFQFNYDGVYAASGLQNSGERMVFNECLFANNSDSQLNDQAGMESMIDNSSIDFNATNPPPTGPAIFIGGVTGISAGHLYISNSHFEFDASSAQGLIYSNIGAPNINIQNTTFLLGASSSPSIIGVTSSSIVTVLGGFAYYNTKPAIPFVTGASSKSVMQGATCTNVSGC